MIAPSVDLIQEDLIPKEEELSKFPWKQFFLEYILPQLHKLMFAVFCAVIGAVINMKIPVELGHLINKINNPATTQMDWLSYWTTMKDSTVKLVTLYLLQGLTSFAYISLLSNIGEQMAAEMRRDLFSSYLHQDIEFFDLYKSGHLIERLTSDVQDFKSSFKLCISQGLKSSMQIIGCFFSLYMTSHKMTLMLCTSLPVLMLIGSAIGSNLRQISRKAQMTSSEATGRANEIVGNVETVRSFANEDFEVDQFDILLQTSKDINQRLGVGIGIFQGLSNTALNAVVFSVIYTGGYLVTNSHLTSGDLMTFLVSAQIMQRSMTSISILFGSGVRSLASGSRVFEHLNATAKIPLRGGDVISDDALKGVVRFNDVTFAYPHRPNDDVINKLNLTIPGASTVALCGPSGGGKSTVAKLLERFYDVTSGSITIDDVDIRALDPTWLRGDVISIISQEPVLFSGTIFDNIRYGKANASVDDVIEAARLAHVDEFVSRFPDGFETRIGERGTALSGGQKQRIAIARALLRNPAILILDEATSALDSQSESRVQEALQEVMKGRSVLVIAHRLTSIRDADLIYVINDGRVAEMGTHQELMDLGGVYKRLVELQEEKEDL